MKEYNILKNGKVVGQAKGDSEECALESYLMIEGFHPRDLKDEMFMQCWKASLNEQNGQLGLLLEIQNVAKINVVTCGSCGGVLLHRIKESDIDCPHCNYRSEPCDFPDFIH